MVFVLLRFAIEDLEKWKRVFKETLELRKNAGSVVARGFNNTDKPNEVFVLVQYADREKAVQLYQSQAMREAMQNAGVKGEPEIVYLNEVARLPS